MIFHLFSGFKKAQKMEILFYFSFDSGWLLDLASKYLVVYVQKYPPLRFFLGLICASKGTVSEKAMALFHLFSYVGPEPNLEHINPISHATHIIIERNEGKNIAEENQFAKPPKEEDIKKMALHFQAYVEVYVYERGAVRPRLQEMLVGEVFIPNLTPYVP